MLFSPQSTPSAPATILHVLAGPTFVKDAATRITATLRAFLETRDGPKGGFYHARRLLRDVNAVDSLPLLRTAAAQDFVPAACALADALFSRWSLARWTRPLCAVELHDVRAEERMVGLIERWTVLSPAQLARCLEHLADEGDAEASFQLTLFNIYSTERNLLKAERLLRQLDTDGHSNAAMQFWLLLHTLQDGPDGDRAALEFFTESSASCDADAIIYCGVLHALGVGVAKNVALAFALFLTLLFGVLPADHVLPVWTASSLPARSFGRKKAVLFLIHVLIRPFPF